MPNSKYYRWDSHGRNIAGFPVPDDTVLTVTFHSLQGMNHYMKIFAMHIKADTFELTSIQIRCNVSQPCMIKGFSQQECIIYINMLYGAMSYPMSGMMNTYFHEQIQNGNKHKIKLPNKEALCLQHHDKKGSMHLKSNHIQRFHTKHKQKGKQVGKKLIKIINVMRI